LSKDPKAGVWVLADDRAGNRTQAIGLAEALKTSYVIKDLRFGVLSRLHNMLLGASVAGLDRVRRGQLAPPWPRLVISAGRRTAPVARWIKRQSGGQTQTVQLGRKGGQDPRPFDAVVTPVHAGLPGHPKRIETLAPLNRVSGEALDAAAAGLDPFGDGPQPRIALLVGGATPRQSFGAAEAQRLGDEISTAAAACGGTLVAVTSPRTGAPATDALTGALGTAGEVYPWRPNDPGNPYLACLARADIIVVTGDSESMIAEAAATGKAVYIFPLAQQPPGRWLRLGTEIAEQAGRWRAGESGLMPVVCGRLVEMGLERPPRDMSIMHTALESLEYVKIFDGTLSAQPPSKRFYETEHVAESLRALLNLFDLDGV